MKTQVLIVTMVGAMAVFLLASGTARAVEDGKHYKVFIFAGQSNARGKAHNVLADAQAEAPETKDFYQHLRKDGKWIVRDDVFFIWRDQGASGPLKLGMGSFRGGSDYEFGSMMGDRFEEPVLIVKSAYGGSSLCKNFRSPSAGYPATLEKELEQAQARVKAANEKNKKNDPLPTLDDIKKEYGVLYRQILDEYKVAIQSAGKEFPPMKGRTPELTGFVWFQGWNDQYGGQDEYASNLKHFIKDLRQDLGVPNLPFVIVAMGQNGSTPASGALLTICEAQMGVNEVPEFKGNVKAFRADLLVDKEAERLANEKDKAAQERDKDLRARYVSDEAYHYYGSPLWYMRIGHSIGETMNELSKQ